MSSTEEWPAEWLRGVLELCVLRILADGPTYGYEISSRLATGGLGKVKGGTLYPLLQRFEASGRVDIEWRPGEGGPGRKYYVLTDQGRAALEQMSRRWRAFAEVTEQILEGTAKSEERS
ncbi:PadR family transcriptional regulator [Nesterenkonia sp. MY13]|uniref:PadR family transcriptional regulator n=1 Tax=Nesterenkonia sedimenti TaxID=1463632 RepID=A0A7X8YD80_9MICC|nr:PadR family transcriptional regulator [Nesterenkonia sedimenti]NLS08857.1 PadR family transcriptional regulator [Nesterenkonia sedimenti]